MMNKIIRRLRENISLVVVICIVIVASILRIQAYGDLRLSIAGNDTQSYIDASQVPLFSSEMLTGRRLLTTNLLYRIFEPQDGYEILVNGSIETTRRVIQPGFNGIVIFQLVLSLLGWGMLAIIISNHMKSFLTKVLSTVIILFFAFSPHLADCDSILMSESLTFSLFILEFAVLIQFAFLLYKNPNANVKGWITAWVLVHFIWTFIRDTNLFVSIVTIGLIAILYFLPRYRNNKQLHFLLFFLTAISIVGLITASQSTRSQVQLVNIYHDDLLASPLRTEILKEMGMPDRSSPEYKPWFEENASSTLIKFMLKHPGYPITKIINDFPWSFTEIKQTYFNAPELKTRNLLMAIGDALHPQSTTPFFAGLLLLIGLIQLSIKNIGNSRAWAWSALWLFVTSTLMLIPTILGDTWALNRHALLSTTIYRLSMWLFAIIVMDIALSNDSKINLAEQSES